MRGFARVSGLAYHSYFRGNPPRWHSGTWLNETTRTAAHAEACESSDGVGHWDLTRELAHPLSHGFSRVYEPAQANGDDPLPQR